MSSTTIARLVGGAVLLLNLYLIGAYSISGLPVLLMTFGFAVAYELLVVRLLLKSSGPHSSDEKRQ